MLVFLEEHVVPMMKCKVRQVRVWSVVRFVGRRHTYLGRSGREKDMARVKVQNQLTKSSQSLAVADRSGKDQGVGTAG